MNTLSILVSTSKIIGSSAFIENLIPNGYSHVLSANGGFSSAQMSITGQQPYLEGWFQNGLGRHIEVYDDALALIWEGFVDQISLSMGPVQVSRGPLMGIVNKVNIAYQTVTYNTNPPIGGNSTSTGFASDTDSQDIYGIFEQVVSGGTLTSTEAGQVQNTYLEEMKNPETSVTINTSGTNEPVLSLSCLGYGALLEKYYYSDTGSGTITASQAIQDILTADPNSIFSTDYTRIDTNSTSVSNYDNDQQTALAAIKRIVALGDSSYNRYIFGIYGNAQAVYTAVPTTTAYYMSVRNSAIEITDGSNVIPYWSIRPGRWLQLFDFLPGVQSGNTIRENPRQVFIESVSFTTPYDLSINGSKVGKLSQVLARQGLSGI